VADKRREAFAPARFDEVQIVDDLTHLPEEAATALRAVRRDIDRDGGIAASRLKKCEAEGRDGTHLPGCLKTYVPWPDGRYGVVFRSSRTPHTPGDCSPSLTASATNPAAEDSPFTNSPTSGCPRSSPGICEVRSPAHPEGEGTRRLCGVS
jgi:hypothetical protein